jgi:flagellar hook-length control protein FliK
LQKVIEPVLPRIRSNISLLNSAPLQDTQDSKDQPADSEDIGNIHMSQNAEKTVVMHTGNKHAAVKKQSTTESNSNNFEIVSPTKSKLELLTAKNAIYASFATDSSLEAVNKLEPEVTFDSPLTVSSPTLQLTDMLKMPIHTVNTLEAVPQTISADNFAQEMTEHVLKNMRITLSEGISEAKLSLFPKNLGHVEVKITMHEGQLVAHFAADTLAGKQMLESQLSQLRQSLQSQGLQVEKLEVTQNSNMQSTMFQDQRNQQSSNQSFRQNKNRSGKYDQENLEFVHELSGATQERTISNGNSFDVIA